ncbi:uncharacterized protein SETTUDRAFT_38930 [Exserohilum turcica Et28A]|uniref:Nucleotide-diphospho-sugar transferase domain-containing protein n=1 Tax=Exserohilum turcicum (strain 28A) TaxID=671987 RepID=R0ITY8_EXST2|nr:uncharacterized protein SETTUDRAFT_38930 [Exserohilum turcica Et28A]EOA88260.1 hypothetical protein SETTUDRAFT_38930 [Exserohilum turcica Et28A]
MMLPSVGGRSPLFTLSVSAACVLVFMFAFLAWQSPPRMVFHGGPNTGMAAANAQADVSISDVIRLLYKDLKTAPTEPFIREPNGSHITLPPNPRYKKTMGSDILVLDLETRPLPSTEAYRKGEYDWREINHVSGGVFNHYTYALVHGYDYKFIHASEFEDRHATWIKPSALANHIKNYKFIVFLDADAAFRFLHVPIEWLLNYWDIQPHHSFVMAKDPWTAKEPQYNSDRFNRTYTNTGFMIVQNNKDTMPILKAWHECPDDTRYANCSQWKQPRFHEQSAFGEYIRYDYENNIKELECAEANGFPGVEISNCQGKFIRHYWFDKSNVKIDFRENIMNALTLPIQKVFAENIGGIIQEQKENIIQ